MTPRLQRGSDVRKMQVIGRADHHIVGSQCAEHGLMIRKGLSRFNSAYREDAQTLGIRIGVADQTQSGFARQYIFLQRRQCDRRDR